MLIKFWESFFKSDFFIHGGGSTPYAIQKSLRFRAAASANLSRTAGVPTNNLKWTWSGWVKRGTLGAVQPIFGGLQDANNFGGVRFDASNNLMIYRVVAAALTTYRISTRVFRDPSAWYHVVVAYDAANATANDRIKVYINGVEETSFSALANPGVSDTLFVNVNGFSQYVARDNTFYADCYTADIYFIDGQALTPSSFGKTDPVTSAWVPIAYTGTYGTNGFYLGFDTGTSLTTLGDDQSVNSNNWTLNNISITAGVTYDWMSDTPTNNYAVLNAVATAIAPVSANLSMSTSSASYSGVATMLMTSGKWYWEVVQTSGTAFLMAGISKSGNAIGTAFWGLTGSYAYYISTGQKYSNGTPAAYGAAAVVNDIIGVAFDASAGTLEFYKNNVSQGVAFTGLTTGDYLPAIGNGSGVAHVHAINFGQRPFTYTPPTGYKALCTQNLPTPAIKRGDDHFKAKTRTGTGAAFSVTGERFSPDLVWTKGRSGATDHAIYDSVRGATKDLVSNSTAAETTQATGITAFNSDGFSGGALAKMNTNLATYIDWMWNESVTAGFDIVSYTGNGANRTVAHGLGVAPKMIIIKNRTGVFEWIVWHTALLGTEYLLFSTTNAKAALADVWNSTTPTSSVFSLGTNPTSNNNTSAYIAYLFAEVEGFSKIGSYTGNGSADGPFIYCGFRPAFVLIKRVDAASAWALLDTARNAFNGLDDYVRSDVADAETSIAGLVFDCTSNGIKIRGTQATINTSGGTYIFMAFAEVPFKYANAR